MKTQLTFWIVSVFFAAALLSQASGTNGRPSPTFEDSPTTISKRFFDRSIGKKARDSLTRQSPESFTECLMLTAEDCGKQRAAANLRKSKPTSLNGNEFDLRPNRGLSVSVGYYLESLGAGKVKLVSVVSEFINGAEARVRVDLDFEGERLTKDILLSKESDWQIFEIAAVGEHVNFATAARSAVKVETYTPTETAADIVNRKL